MAKIITSNPWTLKYRPLKFKDVTGQKSAVDILKTMVEQKEIPNAILLAGPYGCGKTTLARIFARYINCEHNKACGKCRACKQDPSPDVTEMNAASARGIDDIRAMIQQAKHVPTYNIRFFILDELHQLTSQAISAFLKPLEEPSATTCYILCTNEVQKLPGTVISRCRRLDLFLPTRDDIADRLATIAEAESFKLKRDALLQIAEASGGHVRDAVNMLQSAKGLIKSSGDVKGALTKLVQGSTAGRLVASKMLIAMYKDSTKALVSAMLDHEASGEQVIPFLNMALRMNEYVLATLVDNHNSVWHTQEHKEFKALVSKHVEKMTVKNALAAQHALVSMRQKAQYSGIPDRSLLLGGIGNDLK